jgi:hypothetical protein
MSPGSYVKKQRPKMPTEREAIRKLLRERPEHHAALRKAIEEGRLKSTDEIPNDEEIVIICGPDHGGVEGSKQVQCGCGELVWLSPSTQALLIERGRYPTRIICMSCFRKEREIAKERPH